MSAVISAFDHVHLLLPVAAFLGVMGAVFSKQIPIIGLFALAGGLFIELAALDLVSDRSFSPLTLLLGTATTFLIGMAVRRLFVWLSPSYH